MEGFHVLFAGAEACVLCRRVAASYRHFAGVPVQPPLVTLALRATPDDPLAIAVTGAVVYILGKAVEMNIAHRCRKRFDEE